MPPRLVIPEEGHITLLIDHSILAFSKGRLDDAAWDRGRLRLSSEMARRLQAILDVADFLTERSDRPGPDVIVALDVLHEAARESCRDLSDLIGTLADETANKEA
jgi:hypothetical protein